MGCCRISDGRLPRILKHGQRVGQSSRPGPVWIDVALSDIHDSKSKRYTHDSLSKPVCREVTCVLQTDAPDACWLAAQLNHDHHSHDVRCSLL